MEKKEENKEEKNWYKKREEYWASVEPNLTSVLGNENIQLPDVKCSCELLNGLILSKQLNPKCCLDCAAGIGRVTEYVLSNFFNEIDLFEKDEKFVNKTKEIFKNNKKVKNIICSGIENFEFKRKYDLIWIQWTLENIEDYDLIPFLKKCKDNLNDNGIIIIKENYYFSIEDESDNNDEHNKNFEYSKEDFSKQRLDSFYINLFVNNGFKIIHHFINPNWPENIMPLIVYVLEKLFI